MAVVAVLLGHLDLGCPGGFVGVDVFFVISGYLITSILLREIEQGEFRITLFLQRRVRRILPAAALVTYACLVVGWQLMLPKDYKELGQSVIAQSLFLSNVYFWRESGYFAAPSEAKPLLHYWSLAVEEQFYLLFPLILIPLSVSKRTACRAVATLAAVGSFAWSVYATYHNADAAYYLLHSRAWELVMGAAAARRPFRSASPLAAEAMSGLGVLAILASVCLYDETTRFPGVAALVPCAGTAAVIVAGSMRPTLVYKTLSRRPFVFVGLISYSLYLWHWPLLVFTKDVVGNAFTKWHALAVLCMSFVAAVASWRFVETPFRTMRKEVAAGKVIAAGVITQLALLIVGVGIHATQGAPWRVPEKAQQYAAALDFRPDKVSDIDVNLLRSGTVRLLGSPLAAVRKIDFAVWGDSHARSLSPAFGQLAAQKGLTGCLLARSATLPLLGVWRSDDSSMHQVNAEVIQFLERHGIRNVFLVGRWAQAASASKSGWLMHAEQSPASEDQAKAVFRDAVTNTIAKLQAAGVQAWVVLDVPTHSERVPVTLVKGSLRGMTLDSLGVPFQLHQAENGFVDDVLRNAVDLRHVIDPNPLAFNDRGYSRLEADGAALYYDEHHLTAEGARILEPALAPALSIIAAQR